MFVDDHSDFTYVHSLKFQTRYEAVEEKEDFEAYAEPHCVNIKHYHADNGIFRGARLMKHCKEVHQGLTFLGVKYHHQNGRVERCI